ncbi:MAG: FAD:protein FMN transferase [Patescibacteria group bacterium]|nr:FAD:protein FMN transferase [Patescibacteria group bacterium]
MNQLIQDKKMFMNTFVEFSAWTSLDRYEVYKLFDKGFAKFQTVVDKFSRFNTHSELSFLNSSQGRKVIVSKELFKLINYALKIAGETNGTFDPTVIDFLETYGYDSAYNFHKLQHRDLVEKEIKKILENRPSYKDIKLFENTYTIQLAQNQRVDLGGIGKGYAIDLAYRELGPLENYIINAGGDIRVKGTYKDKAWEVGLNVPAIGKIGKVRLNNEAICCSGSWARKVKFFHHLINPQTGSPQSKVLTVFVIRDSAKEADAWTTALYASGKSAFNLAKKCTIKALIIYNKYLIKTNKFPHIC